MGSIGRKSVGAVTNLAKLLPTGTVLAYQAIIPSFSNNGNCLPSNKYLTLSAIVICSAICFLSSFTDSFDGRNNKLYYGIATPTGLCVFNNDGHEVKSIKEKKGSKNDRDKDQQQLSLDMENRDGPDPYYKEDLEKYKLEPKDFLHAILSPAVFLVFGFNSSEVQRCIFPHWGKNGDQLMLNLPIGVSALASAVFMIFPTKRRGLGSAEKTKPKPCPNCGTPSKDKRDKNGAGTTPSLMIQPQAQLYPSNPTRLNTHASSSLIIELQPQHYQSNPTHSNPDVSSDPTAQHLADRETADVDHL